MKTLIVAIFFLTFHSILSQNVTEVKVDSIFNRYSDKPGVSVGIIKKGKIVYQKGFGYSNLDDMVKTSLNTVYDIASLSKQFTGASILLLEGMGKLSLDDPIQKYIPEFSTYKEGTITIRHLLNHTSGIRSYLRLIYAKGESWDNHYTNDDVVNLLKNQRALNYPPGSRFSYSNSGYALLSTIVNRVSGKTLGEFAKENIFAPLGMNNTFYYENPNAIVKNRAIGYSDNGDEILREHFYNSSVTGDGGVYSTTEDLLKWSENFKTQKIGDKRFIAKMLTNGKLNNGTPIEYASGLFVGTDQNARNTISHSGQWAGFNSLIRMYLDQDLTFLILSNNGNLDTWGILDQLTTIYLDHSESVVQDNPQPDNGSSASIETINLPSKVLNAYTGHYFDPFEGLTRNIIIDNGSLFYDRGSGGVKTKLVAISNNEFIFEGAPHVALKFHPNQSGQMDLDLKIGNAMPIKFNFYIPKDYSLSELKDFEGLYESEELDVIYELRVTDSKLLIYINSKELISLKPLMENIFNDRHYNYLKFTKGGDGKIDRFTINDELVRDIGFKRIKS